MLQFFTPTQNIDNVLVLKATDMGGNCSTHPVKHSPSQLTVFPGPIQQWCICLSHCSLCSAWSLSPGSCEVSTCTHVQAHTACICVAVVQQNTQEKRGVSCWKARRKQICSGINKIIHMCLEQAPDSYYTAPLQRPTSHHSSAKWKLLIAQTLEITEDVAGSQRIVCSIVRPPPSHRKSSIQETLPIIWKPKYTNDGYRNTHHTLLLYLS